MPLLLIGGLAGRAARRLVGRLAERGTAVVQYDLRRIADGEVHRRLRLNSREHDDVLHLRHGCVSCTVRIDLLPLLRDLAADAAVRRIVVRLDEAMEPDRVCWELRHAVLGDGTVLDHVAIEGVVTVLDGASWLADATGDDLMAERGLAGAPDDDRTVAQVALSQVEAADVLVLSGAAPDNWVTARTGAVLDRIAPAAAIVHLSTVDPAELRAAIAPSAGRGELPDPHGALVRGQPPLEPDCGVALCTFVAHRPFHPQRLYDTVDVLLDGVVRARGRVWVASRPDAVLWLESAGGALGLGHAGSWLAADDGPVWADVSPERRTCASLRWHPVWGDRAQELVIVTHRADPADIERALDTALLTDAELAGGRAAWARYPDPFGPHDPDETTVSARQDEMEEL